MYSIKLGIFVTQSLETHFLVYHTCSSCICIKKIKKFDGPSTEDKYVNVIEEVYIDAEAIN